MTHHDRLPEITLGGHIGETLRWLKYDLDALVADRFHKIAVPTASVTDAQSPPVVEQPDGGAATHGNAAAPPSTLDAGGASDRKEDEGSAAHSTPPASTLAEFFATYDTPRDDAPSIDVDELTSTIRAHRDGSTVTLDITVDPDDGGYVAIATAIPGVYGQGETASAAASDALDAASLVAPKTLAEWRADMETWDAAKRQAFTEWRFAHGITKDATDDERLAAYEQFHADYAFTDVTSVTETLRKPAPVERPAPPVIDEGDEIPSSSIEAIGAAYKALPDDVRSWVTVTGAEVRLSPQHGGVASVRRYDIMRGLIALARAELDSDDMCRAACDAAIGTDTQMAWPIARVVGSLTLEEAKRFADICVAIEEQPVALNFRSDGRPVVSRSVA